MKAGYRLTTLLFACAFLFSCGRTASWEEEVQLASGEKIKISRVVEHALGGDVVPGGQGTVPKKHIIRFNATENGEAKYEWVSKHLTPSAYAELPLVLDKTKENSWVIYTGLMLDAACVQYIKYELRNNVWEKTALPENFPVIKTNLYLAAGNLNISGLIMLEIKAKEYSDIMYPKRLKQIGPTRFGCIPDFKGPYPPEGAI